MITLKASDMFGKGLHRECFPHPDNNDLCIKVVTFGDQKETEREQGYYKLLEKRNIDWDMLPRFHGNVTTNMGPGAVFELIRDHDGQISKTLRSYLADKSYVDENRVFLLKALEDLKAYLLRNNIITMTIKSKNILYQLQPDNTGKLYIVDNIGNPEIIPYCSYIPFFGNKKIHRKWNRFFKKLDL